MYFQIVVGTGSYTTSTTNMYNKDVPPKTTSGERRIQIGGGEKTPHIAGRALQKQFPLFLESG